MFKEHLMLKRDQLKTELKNIKSEINEELLGKLSRRSRDGDTDFCVAIFTSLEGDNSLLSSGWDFYTEKLPNEYYGNAKDGAVKMNLTTFLEKYA